MPQSTSPNYHDHVYVPGRGIPDPHRPGAFFEVEILVEDEHGDWVQPTEPVHVRRVYEPTGGLSAPLRGVPEPGRIPALASPDRGAVADTENAALKAALKLPAETVDWSADVFDGVVESLRVLRQACNPTASRSTLDFARVKTAQAGMALMDWAATSSSRASLIQALRGLDASDAVDAAAAMFFASMQEYDADKGDGLFDGTRSVVQSLRPNADSVAASLDRVEGRNADGTLRTWSEAAVTWRMEASRLPKISCALLIDMGLEGRSRVIAKT